ncbi:MAG: hypothetical protein J0L75_00840 [Spirochaetes bacterium]|nr:hypothetical protein [Spirochaetota bacterium]
MDRDGLFRSHPFLKPDHQEHLVVCGDDLDALLSAALFLRHHPRARIAGFYSGFRDLLLMPEAAGDLERTVWIDLDISHPACPSLGHHVLKARRDDVFTGHGTSLNLNTLRGVDMAHFRDKYPLGTVHFLAALYEEPIPEGSGMEGLLWLADSAFISGQSHQYRENMGRWLEEVLVHPDLRRAFDRLDEPAFEEGMGGLMDGLRRSGFRGGRVQSRSYHRALGGFSIKVKPTDLGGFARLSGMVAEFTGWPDLAGRVLRGEAIHSRGRRRRESMATVLGGRSLGEFLGAEGVFSYALPGLGEMNYTTGIHPEKRG